MAVINGKLNALAVPGFPGYVAPFGTMKPEMQHISSRENNENVMLPFKKQRPIDVTETSSTTDIESNLVFDIKTSGTSLTLGNATFHGCRIKVLNSSDDVVQVIYGEQKTKSISTTERFIEFDFTSDGWVLSVSGIFSALEKKQNRIVGQYCDFGRELSEWELVTNRMLKLEYQLIKISDYQELCDFMYCGDDKNDIARFWYKCDEDGTRNINGEYMRVAAWQGMFPRVAGVNPVLSGADGTPYDGGNAGDFISDAIRNIKGSIENPGGIALINMSGNILTQEGALFAYNFTGGITGGATTGNYSKKLGFDASRAVPTSYENCSASLSDVKYIAY